VKEYKPMKRIIRLTESDLHRLIRESVLNILAEDGEAGGGGATNAAGVMQGGGTNPGAGQYDVPAFGGKKPKEVGGNPFNQSPIIRRPSPVGEPTNKKDKGVDLSGTLDRKGGKNHSIAMNHVGES
jgi:hypothetical protein